MDFSTIRNGRPADLAQYLKDSASRIGSTAVTNELLAGIQNESLPPRVYSLWLSVCQDAHSVRKGLQFEYSVRVRRASIKHFGRLFRSRRVDELWQVLGGTDGVVAYLAEASVQDVRLFCSEIGGTGRTVIAGSTRQEYVDGLYRCLRDASRNPDQRPLTRRYCKMLPACSQRVIASTPCYTLPGDVRKSVFEAHTLFLRDQFLGDLHDSEKDIDISALFELLAVQAPDHQIHQGERISANIVFPLQVIDALSNRHRLEALDTTTFRKKIARPLFQRLCQRERKPDIIAGAVQSYVRYLERHAGNATYSENIFSINVTTFVVRAWSRCPDQLDASLQSIFRLLPSSARMDASYLTELLKGARRALRFRLLELAMRNLRCLNIDITSNADLERSGPIWSPQLFLALPRAESKHLLQRLMDIFHDKVFDGLGEFGLRQPADDPEFVLMQLSKGDSEHHGMVANAVDHHKSAASNSRAQPLRAYCASYALRCASISGSLDLYRGTLLWTRKYIQDPQTAIGIFYTGDLKNHDTIELLSGIPEDLAGVDVSRDAISDNVRKGNQICQDLVETALLASHEPSFQDFHWKSAMRLTAIVLRKRLETVDRLQDFLQLSDEETFDTVWESTLMYWASFERQCLEEDKRELFYPVRDPLIEKLDGSAFRELRPATARFIDELALRQDETRLKWRERHFPLSRKLPDPYSRGDPYKPFILMDFTKLQSTVDLPWLRSRAEQVVFLDPESALSPVPESEEVQQAIAYAVDNWEEALEDYVLLSQNKQVAASTAWKHATEILSLSRMSAVEAHVFWSPRFTKALAKCDVRGPWTDAPRQLPQPRLPVVHSDEEAVEWNPDPKLKGYIVKPRKLTPTRLDTMLVAKNLQYRDPQTSSWLEELDARVPKYEPSVFWRRAGDHSDDPATREALVATVVMYVAGKSGSSGLLSKPFPRIGASRFPAMFLDGDFLDRDDLAKHPVQHLLAAIISDIPPTLLTELVPERASNLIESQGAISVPQLLRLLVRSDRPQAALEVVRSFILDVPESSSWHRSVLKPSFFRSLPRKYASEFFESLVMGVEEKLTQQTARKSDGNADQGPAVKVSTVKMVSKLLSSAGFMDEDTATQILIDLFTTATHIDVRVSVIESLLDVLKQSTDSNVRTRIIAFFERDVVPIMASMSERTGPLQGPSESLDADVELPEVYFEGVSFQLTPMLQLMFKALKEIDASTRKQIVTRVLLPAFHGSIESNKRWLSLCLRQMGIPQLELPAIPVEPSFLINLLDHPADVPIEVLGLWLEYFTVIFSPSTELAAVTSRIEQDPELHDWNAGRHWLTLFGKKPASYLLQKTSPVSMIRNEWQATEGGMSIDEVQSVVLRQANVVLQNPDPNLKQWEMFAGKLAPPPWGSKQFLTWEKYSKPIVDYVVRTIDGIASSEGWLQDPARTPAILPDRFGMYLWIWLPHSSDTDRDFGGLASFISSRLGFFDESRRAYGRRFEQLVSFVQKAKFRDSRVLGIALRLGDLEKHDVKKPTTSMDLHVDFAKRLVQGVGAPPSTELQQQVVSMAESWATCLDEETKMQGIGLLNAQDMYGKAWYAAVG
ncbi:hypothetical protein TI39_contig377g00001 [Zymoseptoria brevis]|uniref:Uncharacterized protein n=1 Tax=Zymoseptoria brevis TaxID=1047168 RepID=A0A0F4GNR0_9PEZI|nr:hypothetical protein TI39_contig377g00001 [Zymoseptoria brevis]